MRISKKTIQLYKLRDIGDCGWADISIDEGEQAGRISIASDWGSWQFYWGSCGKPFKQFLIGLSHNMDYVAGKMNADRWFDFDATIKKLKNDVLISRRNNYIEEEQARSIFNEIKEIENESPSDANHFVSLFYDTENLCNWRDADTETDVTPQFKAFWKKAFLPFLEHLKLEVTSDASVFIS
jgi:hypothetical protein